MFKHIILILCVYVSCVFCVESGSVTDIQPEIQIYDSDKDELNLAHGGRGDRRVDATLFMTINQYYCSLDSFVKGNELVVFGSKSWNFPLQDVNLTLRYPSVDNAMTRDGEAYIITGIKVNLYIDGLRSKGYIIDGGILKESIALTFVSRQLSTLRYDFYVYGVRKDIPGILELISSMSYSCN